MTDTVTEENETAQEVVEKVLPETTDEVVKEEPKEKKEEFVPLSAHVAERKKRQEAEQRAQWLEQQMMTNQKQAQQPQINPDDLLTVGQQHASMNEWKRSILEESYMEQNPDIIEKIKEELPDVLNDPRHKWLADSIAQAPNRLLRAAQVLEMVKPRKQAVAPQNRDNVPKSPQSIAKTNKLSITDRIMEMSDKELEDWRLSRKKNVR